MSPDRKHDPFETIVELTAAAMRGRPPRDFVYAEHPALREGLSGLLHRFALPTLDGDVRAANDYAIHESPLLRRYY